MGERGEWKKKKAETREGEIKVGWEARRRGQKRKGQGGKQVKVAHSRLPSVGFRS